MAKRRTSRKKKSGGYGVRELIIIALLLFLAYYGYRHFTDNPIKRPILTRSGMLQQTEENYGGIIDSLAPEFGISPYYLKALITLECSGRTEFEPRFEKHVFKALKNLRDGVINRYGSIKRKTVINLSDGGLRNLATSWGPFQLMGYQCLELGVYVHHVRGKDAVYWGIKLIKKRYGKYLKKGRYKDAFHIHNTGRPYPLVGDPFTHDPDYVNNGLEYMEWFKELDATSFSTH